jgi:hypothetical protein
MGGWGDLEAAIQGMSRKKECSISIRKPSVNFKPTLVIFTDTKT